MPDPVPPAGAPSSYADCGLMEAALHNELVRWREALARNIARNNLALHSDGIMTATNRVLFPLILIRAAEDRGLLAAGTLAALRHAETGPDLFGLPGPYADALYAGECAAPSRDEGTIRHPAIDERVVHTLLDDLLSPARRYDFRVLTTGALARILGRYLARTVRRSAAHQAVVVDTHGTVLAGGTDLPPGPLVDYLAGGAVRSARKNRSVREILPLRIFDPCCGSGLVLLAVFRRLREDAGGPALTFEEQREILVHSVHGLDISRHAVAAARMVLLLELLNSRSGLPAPDGFGKEALAVLRDLGRTVLCGNALIGPEIESDESWMFCPARDRHRLNPFSYRDRFAEIVAAGGFDAVISAPQEGALERHEWIQQYFQRRYAAYHPLADRSLYFFEKGLALVAPGGTVAMVMSARFLRGAPGSPFRGLLTSRRIDELADLSGLPAGSPGALLCLLRVRVTRPGRPFSAVMAGPGFIEDPAGFSALYRFPVDQTTLDAGGWTLRDTRAAAVMEKVRLRGTPLLSVVMGQVYEGIRIADDDPSVIDGARAREWIRRDARCKEIVRPLISVKDTGQPDRFIIVIPEGWTRSHPEAEKDPWQWLKRRYPSVARHLQQSKELLKARAGPGALWWETACDGFWQVPHRKLVFPASAVRPRFWFDAGRGIGDESVRAVPSSGQYLAGVLNSRLMTFVLGHAAGASGSGKDPLFLPVYTPDLDRPEERERYDRIERLVRRMADQELKFCSATEKPQRELLQKSLLATGAKIDALVYALYGLAPDEIAVVERQTVTGPEQIAPPLLRADPGRSPYLQ